MARHINLKKQTFKRRFEEKLKQRFEYESQQYSEQDLQRQALGNINTRFNKIYPHIGNRIGPRRRQQTEQAILDTFEKEYDAFILKLKIEKKKKEEQEALEAQKTEEKNIKD